MKTALVGGPTARANPHGILNPFSYRKHLRFRAKDPTVPPAVPVDGRLRPRRGQPIGCSRARINGTGGS